MKIGVPKEIKPQENRIGLTPDSVKTLVSEGHEVLVENKGGFEAGFDNDQYKKSGAKIVNKAEDIFNDSEIIVKVKEPLANEIKLIRENQIVFTYLHLAAGKQLTEDLVKSKADDKISLRMSHSTDKNPIHHQYKKQVPLAVSNSFFLSAEVVMAPVDALSRKIQ